MNDWNKLILGEEDSQTAPVCNGTVREMIAEIDRLKAELEEGQQERDNLRSHIHGLRGVVDNLERQLAEARAQVAEFKATIQPGCCGIATCPGVAEARQEAAIECLEIILNRKGYNQFAISDIKIKFGLEG